METKYKPHSIEEMFCQLIFTIYKEKAKDQPPPLWLGVCDIEKIAFVLYSEIDDLFNEYKTADFN